MAQARRSLLPLTGAVFFVLFVLTFILSGEAPGADESGEEIISFFSEDESKHSIASIVGALAAVFFLFFVGSLRSVLRPAEGGPGTLSAVAFGGGVVAATGMLIFSAIAFTLVEGIDNFEPAAAQVLNAMNMNFFFPLAGGLATLLIATGLVSVRTGALPSWLAWAALVIGAATVTPLGFFAFLASIAWVLVASIVLWMGVPAASTTPA